MLVIFSDLDGTLLDSETYSHDAAHPALQAMRNAAVPLILCSSKTRAEIESWRVQLNNREPFIAENGGALYVPRGYFPFDLHAPVYRDGYAVIEFGDPYPTLVATLRAASEESGCRVVGFHQMTVGEISARSGIPIEHAALARQREYDEPFQILGSGGESLLACIVKRGKRWTRGGRFHHILGANDKSLCVLLLAHFFQRAFGELTTVGLGDAMNDAGFLNVVDLPIVIKSKASSDVARSVRRAQVSDHPGPAGWNQAVLGILRSHRHQP